ncbi:NAD-dependent epimerase/dehydratase family protein [Kitasatospora sp. NPDC001603]|uniref:NAD-dependent epimerase/dehydratase family protein n=1 Tax=Kitasatospora sp. NPDC001603 TaxID=3154388 RepID=UPI0033322C0C
MPRQKVLVTGANGYIGQAVSTRLQIAGHHVTGMVRSEHAARSLYARGISPLLATLDDSEAITKATHEVDAVIDTASADHAPATHAMLDALHGTGKTYIRTSGTGVYTDLAHGHPGNRIYTEDDAFTPDPLVATRVKTDHEVVSAASRGINTIVIRPSMIYGDGASEQLPMLIRHAIAHRSSFYVGPGENRWANVHIADLAEAYLLALTYATAGSLYNIAADEASLHDIAQAIATLLDLPTPTSCSPETAYAAFGQRWVDIALSSNSRVDSTKARTELRWNPTGPTLLDDITHGSYRRIWAHKVDPHDHTATH